MPSPPAKKAKPTPEAAPSPSPFELFLEADAFSAKFALVSKCDAHAREMLKRVSRGARKSVEDAEYAARVDVHRARLKAKACVDAVERLRWAAANGCPLNDAGLCALVARRGCLEALKWAREQGCPWDASTPAAAARGGHLEVLKWANEQGCPMNDKVFKQAAKGGHLDVIKYLVPPAAVLVKVAPNGDELEDPDFFVDAEEDHDDEETIEEEMVVAASEGYDALADLAEELKTPVDELLRRYRDMEASSPGDEEDAETDDEDSDVDGEKKLELGLEVIVDENDFFVPFRHVVAGAACGGHVHIFNWLRFEKKWIPPGREHDDERMFRYAARGGQLEIIKWLYARDKTPDAWAAAFAARGGHLDVLKFLRMMLAPMDSTVGTGAVMSGNIDVVRWVYALGDRYVDKFWQYAFAARHGKAFVNAVSEVCNQHGYYSIKFSSISITAEEARLRSAVFAVAYGNFDLLKTLRSMSTRITDYYTTEGEEMKLITDAALGMHNLV
jgi:hypothetical protein